MPTYEELMQELQKLATPKRPDGFKTVNEWAKEWGRSKNRVRERLNAAVGAGLAKAITIKVGRNDATAYRFNRP